MRTPKNINSSRNQPALTLSWLLRPCAVTASMLRLAGRAGPDAFVHTQGLLFLNDDTVSLSLSSWRVRLPLNGWPGFRHISGANQKGARSSLLRPLLPRRRVMTVSFHRYGLCFDALGAYPFFPGTGELHDVGERHGKNYSVNVPLKVTARGAPRACIRRSLPWPCLCVVHALQSSQPRMNSKDGSKVHHNSAGTASRSQNDRSVMDGPANSDGTRDAVRAGGHDGRRVPGAVQAGHGEGDGDVPPRRHRPPMRCADRP